MDIKKIKFEDTGRFSKIFLDYINNETPSLKSINSKTKEISFTIKGRELIQNRIRNQYNNLKKSNLVEANINHLIERNTFTVTTGHQLNIFTGPLYVIYKIATTIILANKLNKIHKDKNFVPIYWMASEDHDFDEIKSFRLFGKNYHWNITPSGPVGDIDPKGLKSILKELPERVKLFENAYLKSISLSDAVRIYINELFGKYGLLILDPRDKELKSTFVKITEDDIINNSIKKIKQKEDINCKYKPKVNVRRINFFYVKKNMRERIIKNNKKFEVNNSSIKFSEQDIIKEINQNAESFSPNVIMRCLYQQTILPNVAYIGGPSEIEYWLQFKRFFEFYKVPLPVLIPRNFALLIKDKIKKSIDKLNINFSDIFLEKSQLEKKVLKNQSKNILEFKKEKTNIEKEMNEILSKSKKVEMSMKGKILALKKKTFKEINNIEKQLIKQEKKNHQNSLNELEKIHSKLFPDNKLQERKDNFLNYYLSDKNFIEDIINNLDPLKFVFNIILK